MGHLEVNVEVDHVRTDGLEEPHVMQVKIDGLDASRAWDRAQEVVEAFLRAEIEEQRAVNRQVQAAEGPWCNNNELLIAGQRFQCNLPPGHRGPHDNFQSGRTWAQRTPQDEEQKRLYHQAQINRIWCNESPVEGEPRGHCCNLWRHHAGEHEHDPKRGNHYEESCA